jgi:hypothetical protein
LRFTFAGSAAEFLLAWFRRITSGIFPHDIAVAFCTEGHALVFRHFAETHLHVNTSIVEGFPNTFLRAAKDGVPTVSIQVDPGKCFPGIGAARYTAENLSRFWQASAPL